MLERPTRERRRGAKARAEIAVAALVIACATLLCAVWALRFPMLQEPDEIAHADAAFAYFDAGRPFVVPHATIANFVMPQTRYLMDVTQYRRLRYDKYAAVRNGYGSASYFRRIDAGAPRPSGAPPGSGGRVPYVLAFYPSPYYYLVAAAMRAGWTIAGKSVSGAFFAARLLNVAFFAATVGFAYAVLRKMRFTPRQRLMLLVGIAFFPLATWVGGYVQPDNQSALLMTMGLFGALALRERPASIAPLSCLAAAESILGVTKLQFAAVAIVAFGVAVASALARESNAVRIRALLACVVLPIAAAYSGRYFSPIGSLNAPPAGTIFAHGDALERVRIVATDVMRSVSAAFLGGPTFDGFWFHFGLRAGTAFPRAATGALTALLVALTVLAVAAWMMSQLRLVRRLRRVTERYGVSRALRFVGTDPSLNAYALLTALLVSISAMTNGDLMLQGRYWYPVLVPIVILSVRSFGAALPPSRRRLAVSIACAFWLVYSAIAAPSAVVAMDRDFYHTRDTVPTSELGQVETVAIDGRIVDRNDLRVPPRSVLAVRGDAIDTSIGLPATDVRYRVDGGAERRAASQLPDRTLVVIFNDQSLAKSGFRFAVATRGLAAGPHEIMITAHERRAPAGLPIETVRFAVAVE